MVLLTVYWLKYRAVLKFRFALKDHQPFNGFIGILSNTVFISAFIFIFLNSDFNIVKTTLFYGSKIFLPVNYEYSLMCWYPNCGVVWNHFQPPKSHWDSCARTRKKRFPWKIHEWICIVQKRNYSKVIHVRESVQIFTSIQARTYVLK